MFDKVDWDILNVFTEKEEKELLYYSTKYKNALKEKDIDELIELIKKVKVNKVELSEDECISSAQKFCIAYETLMGVDSQINANQDDKEYDVLVKIEEKEEKGEVKYTHETKKEKIKVDGYDVDKLTLKVKLNDYLFVFKDVYSKLKNYLYESDKNKIVEIISSIRAIYNFNSFYESRLEGRFESKPSEKKGAKSVGFSIEDREKKLEDLKKDIL